MKLINAIVLNDGGYSQDIDVSIWQIKLTTYNKNKYCNIIIEYEFGYKIFSSFKIGAFSFCYLPKTFPDGFAWKLYKRWICF